jgi:peptide/nickel transport system substrate-binding protein
VKRAMKIAAVVALFAASATACRRTDGASPGQPRPIEMIVAADPETLDPRYVADAVGLRVTRLIHAGLVKLDPSTLAPAPYAARTWQWTDTRTLRVELRDDVRFHSGALLTSLDVVATLRAFRSKSVGARHSSVVDAIADAVPDGPGAVIITLARPHATLLTDLEVPILRADQAEGAPDPEGKLDGLGPFRVETFARGEVLLVPADGGVLARPRHAIAIRTIHDENARALRLSAGRADVALNVLSPTLLPAVNGAGLAITSRPGANLTYMVVRVDRGPLADARVRRALALAIDRAGIARSLLAGHAEAAETLLPASHWAYTPTPGPLIFDPAAARALLDAAGLPDEPGHGPRVRLSLLTSTDRLRGTLARYIAQEAADVGIAIEVVPLELGTMLARLAAGDFDVATLQLPELGEPNVLRFFLHSAFIPPAGANRGRVRDAALDALLDEGDRTTGEDARRAVYAEVEARMREELFLIPLWHEDQVAVTSERARAFVPSAEGRWLSLAGLP